MNTGSCNSFVLKTGNYLPYVMLPKRTYVQSQKKQSQLTF